MHIHKDKYIYTCVYICVCVLSWFSCGQLFVELRYVAHQAPLSRQEYWCVLPCPPSGDLPDLGIKLATLMSPALAGGFFTTSTTSIHFSSVAQSCPTIWDPMDCSTPGYPVPSPTPGVYSNSRLWVGDAIQSSHLLSSSSPSTFKPSQHQHLLKWVSYSHQVTKVLEFKLQGQSFQGIFRTDFI